MKVLFITQTFPYPLDTGSRNLIYHWLEACCRVHDVHLLAVTDENVRDLRIPGLDGLSVHLCPIEVSRSIPNRALRQAASLAQRVPAPSYILLSSEVRRRIDAMLEEYRYDLVVLAENVVAGFAPFLRSIAPVLLVKHSVHATDAHDLRVRNGPFNPRWIIEELVERRFESETCHAATAVCCVTDQDAAQLVSRYGLSNRVEAIPVGVDLTQFPQRDQDPDTNKIGFFGNLTWGANVDAVQWFCQEVLPKVWQTNPDAKFVVAGIGGDRLRWLSADGRILFLGRVANIPEALKDVSVGVVPVKSGTGIRFKLLEMLGMGIPTVSTSLGTEGSSCVHGRDLLIADDAETFSMSVNSLLSDASLRRNLASSGVRVASAFSWEAIYPKILTLFDLTVQQRTHTA
jgi:glycosyltransferase involved in cell wall biosynthesis